MVSYTQPWGFSCLLLLSIYCSHAADLNGTTAWALNTLLHFRDIWFLDSVIGKTSRFIFPVGYFYKKMKTPSDRQIISFPLGCGSGSWSSIAKWCGSGSATLALRPLIHYWQEKKQRVLLCMSMVQQFPWRTLYSNYARVFTVSQHPDLKLRYAIDNRF